MCKVYNAQKQTCTECFDGIYVSEDWKECIPYETNCGGDYLAARRTRRSASWTSGRRTAALPRSPTGQGKCVECDEHYFLTEDFKSEKCADERTSQCVDKATTCNVDLLTCS